MPLLSTRDGLPLLGTGNRGKIYRLDSDVISTELVDASPTQVTGFGKGSNGELYAVTGNIGRVYRWGRPLKKPDRLRAKFWTPIRSRIGGASATAARETSRSSRAVEISIGRRATGALGRGSTPDASAEPICDSCGGGRTAPLRRVSCNTRSSLRRHPRRPRSPTSRSPTCPRTRLPKWMTSKSRRPIIASPLLFYPLRRPIASRFRPSGSRTGLRPRPRLTWEASQTLNYAKGYVGARWSAFDEDGDTLRLQG